MTYLLRLFVAIKTAVGELYPQQLATLVTVERACAKDIYGNSGRFFIFKFFFILSFLFQSVSCTFNLELDSLSLLKKSSPISISAELPPINNTNEKNFEIVGSCKADIPSFEISIGGETKTVQCIGGDWKIEVDLSHLDDGVIEVVTNVPDPKTGEPIILEIQKDTASPVITNVILNSEVLLTNKLQIPYQVLGTKVFETYITEDPACQLGSTWQKAIGMGNIAAGDGNKKLYLKVRDKVGNVTECKLVDRLAGDSIALDQTLPVVTGLGADSVVRTSKTWEWGCTDINAPCSYRYSITKDVALDPLGSFGMSDSASQTFGDGIYYINVQARDAAGNISETVSERVILDNTRPTLSLTTTTSETFNAPEFTVTALFSENVSGFEASDIVVANGDVLDFAGAGKLYTFKVAHTNPSSVPATVSVTVAENLAQDIAGNGNTAASLSRTYDENYFLGSMVVTGPSPASGDFSTEFAWTITYDDRANILLSNTDITAVGTGSVTCADKAVSGSGSARLVTLKSCAGQGTVKIHIAKGSALDEHGNIFSANTSAAEATVSNPFPAAAVIGKPSPATGTSTQKFSWGVTISGATSVNLDSSDVVLHGDIDGCVANVTGTGLTSRSIEVTGCLDVGNVSVSLPASVLQGPGGSNLATEPSAPVTLTNQILVSFVNQAKYLIKNPTGTSSQAFEINLSKAHPTKDIDVYYSVVERHSTAINPDNHDIAKNFIRIPAGSNSGVIPYQYKDWDTTGSKVIQISLNKTSEKVAALNKNVALQVISDAVGGKLVAMSTGGAHTCGIKESGELFCWGKNQSGQLGNSSTTDSRVPVPVDADNKYISVSAGGEHTCGIRDTGELFCWGYNQYGQLGNSSTTDSRVPVPVDADNKYISVSAGGEHTCGIRDTGELFCWGNNQYGQLGDGSTENSLYPVPVDGGSKYISLSSGSIHTCAIEESGGLFCWGYNNSGQLGNASTENSNLPVAVNGGGKYTRVSAGGEHTCGIRDTGELFCWGNNQRGQLGIGSTVGNLSPIRLHSFDNSKYISVSAGSRHTCGIKDTGELFCWGANSYGQLGNGLTTDNIFRVAVHGGGKYTRVSAGDQYTCGIKDSGELFCWGYNRSGQLGSNSVYSDRTPVSVQGGGSYTSVSGSGSYTCGTRNGGDLLCWGRNDYGQIGNNSKINTSVPISVNRVGSYSSVSAGIDHTCGVESGGVLTCWGRNSSGQLGNNSTTDSSVPVLVREGSNYISVSSGSAHTCGIKDGGGLFCWGNGVHGQLGNNATKNISAPVSVHGDGRYISVSAGGSHTCGIKDSGELFCWGANQYGQLGNNSNIGSSIPVPVHGGGKYTRVSAGERHTCGIKDSGELFCWGENYFAQLGSNSTFDSSVPVSVHGGGKYISVSAGGSHTCGIKDSGSLFCWGSNNAGQCGNNSSVNSSFPVLVDGGGSYISVSTGVEHTCGIKNGGELFCWGSNLAGQLGEGSLFNYPIFILFP